MDREQFVGTQTELWWLLESEADYQVEALRRDLGAAFGWSDPQWYTEQAKVEQLYDYLHRQSPQLMYELDQATDEERRRRWLDAVVDLKAPAESAPEAAPTARAPAGPAGNSAPVRKSAFKSAPASDASSDPSAVPGVAPGVGARKSIFKAKQGTADSASHPADLGQTAPTLDQQQVVERLDDAVQAVVSGLSDNQISQLANELGLTTEGLEAILSDPQFEGMLKAEAAKLSAP